MLKSVRLVQWRAHEDTTVQLSDRFTALVGANGSGKTSVLDALFRVGRVLHRSTGVFSGEHSIALTKRHDPSPKDTFIAVTGESDAAPWELHMLVEELDGRPSAQFRIGLTDEQREKNKFHWQAPTMERDHFLDRSPNGPGSLQSSVYYCFSVQRIAEGDEQRELKPRIESDGSGLTALLAEWKLNDADRFQAWVADVRSVLPRFRDVRFATKEKRGPEPQLLKQNGTEFYRVEIVRRLFQELLIDFEGERGVAAVVASEGTLLVMTLLAAFHQESLPRLVMLDDIDRGLHPHAQHDLVALLIQILDRKPQTQFIVTTHSPFVVDSLQPEQVVALARNKLGRVVAKRMSEHPKRHLLRQLSMGEFWSAEDEAWVVAESADASQPREVGAAETEG